MNIRDNVPLAPLTGFKIGGPARYYAEPSTAEELKEGLAFAKEKGVHFFVLGEGTNIIVSDDGFPGLIFTLDFKGTQRVSEDETSVTIKVGASEVWDSVVERTVNEGLWGIENLSLIPGLTGGVPIQNVGAYGAEAKNVIESVEVYDTAKDELVNLENKDCGFRYRASRFNSEDKGRFIVLSVKFRLMKTGTPNMNYPDVKKYFAAKNITEPTLQEMRQAVYDIRKYKLPDPKILGNAGSFFKNPIVPREVFTKAEPIVIKERESRENCCYDPWNWPNPDGSIKISAACLMHVADFLPGHRQGRVGIAARQPLVLVNYENGSAKELIEFADTIRKKVFSITGIILETEPEFVGFREYPLPKLG